MGKTIEDFKGDLEKILVRDFIRSALENYDEYQVYIIYDTNKIEIYDRDIFEIKKLSNQFKSYLISRPLRIL